MAPVSLMAQLDKQGMPMNWDDIESTEVVSIWKDLPDYDLLTLQAEDLADAVNKAIPYRFAYSTSVNITTTNAGRWTNLPNGDRVWMLGLRAAQAKALNVNFEVFDIPEGAKVYIYNNTRTDFIGPLQRSQNEDGGSLATMPVDGNEIVIEYFEPYAVRGNGELVINKVAQSYKELSADVVESCFYQVPQNSNNKMIGDLSSAVMLMLVDDGQRIATGTLVNNTRNDGTPYFITSTAALMGDPESWVFVHGLNQKSCSIENAGLDCWERALSGAEVLIDDHASGIALLEIHDRPKTSWGVFYTGWKAQAPGPNHFVCIQQAFGINQSVSLFSGSLLPMNWEGYFAAPVNNWAIGNSFVGSIGSPLFTENGELVGVLVGGNAQCDNQAADYFGMFSTVWNKMESILNPIEDPRSSTEGFYPIFIDETNTTAETMELFVFPNPASEFIYVQNQSDSGVIKVEFIDSSGRLTTIEHPTLPMIDVSTMVPGIYELRIHTASSVLNNRVIIQ